MKTVGDIRKKIAEDKTNGKDVTGWGYNPEKINQEGINNGDGFYFMVHDKFSHDKTPDDTLIDKADEYYYIKPKSTCGKINWSLKERLKRSIRNIKNKAILLLYKRYKKVDVNDVLSRSFPNLKYL